MVELSRKERFELVRRFAERLKFPQLFLLLLILFVVDLFIPDPIPFIDEIILGLLTVVFATWKQRKKAPMEPVGDKAPPSS